MRQNYQHQNMQSIHIQYKSQQTINTAYQYVKVGDTFRHIYISPGSLSTAHVSVWYGTSYCLADITQYHSMTTMYVPLFVLQLMFETNIMRIVRRRV